MSDDTQQPIVVKRVRKGNAGGHGGAWKIAYADFVTAMMAFFLLMWLLGSTTKGDLAGIANYFKTPLKVALEGGSGSGDSSSILKGGGQDLTRTSGQVKHGNIKAQKRTINLQALPADFAKREAKKLSGLKQKLEAMIDNDPELRQFRNQLLFDITSEGLRIQIIDAKNRAMFDSASAVLKPYTRTILDQIGKVLNNVPNKISLSGHTDATPFAGGRTGYSNWELSAARANAARRQLIAGGMDPHKVMRVVGLASAVPFDPSDPFSPANRRITIIVLNKRTEQAIRNDAGAGRPQPAPAEASLPAPPKMPVKVAIPASKAKP